jgi:uncharacterized protein with ACT and thioredoxin-like domain
MENEINEIKEKINYIFNLLKEFEPVLNKLSEKIKSKNKLIEIKINKELEKIIGGK